VKLPEAGEVAELRRDPPGVRGGAPGRREGAFAHVVGEEVGGERRRDGA
jgi:hypothetical protein